ncbi:uncharacterized protein H6S33_000427 [Morchella sextelata]|uniref:uncharacterized protein n=1 Tax=Morchella sextelata TaxID=1174677 RepID=UPI001D04D4D4|nr:uncharacterized protein H6S33_000427 [Morchella sextelata]KAH0614791.1 hypothetical protein H6S33_000427 [Morchella sextelata]
MTTYNHDRTSGAPVQLNLASSNQDPEKAHDDAGSPKPRGRSPPGSFPFHLKNPGHASPASSTTGPGSDFGPLSPDVADLVYPIKSVVNVSHPVQVQPRPTSPSNFWGSNDSTTGSVGGGVPLGDEASLGHGLYSRSHSKSPRGFSMHRRPSVVSIKDLGDGGSDRKRSMGSIAHNLTVNGEEDEDDDYEEPRSGGMFFGGRGDRLSEKIEEETFITARFKHKMTKDGHAIVTGVSGAETLQRCEDEPIHIPGAVQGFGALLALREDASGALDVKIASENSKLLIGYSPAELFALSDFCNILSEEQAENLYEHLDFARDDSSDLQNSGPEVFPLVITAPDSTRIKVWCAIHITDANPDLIVCEFELEDDQLFPLFNPEDEVFNIPEDTLGSTPSEEDFLESTLCMSRPLRVLRRARKRRGQAATMEVFNLMSQIQDQLSSATSLDAFLKISVGVVKELTGFHRVMIYQFDESWNGRVVTELVDPRATKDLYKGLNFPASDIPKQARDLYRINKVRLLYDRDQETARLVCKSKEFLDKPLDMTHSYLRAMSPIHLKYLKNMSVRASMSISITAFDELWGLVSCHTYGQKGMRVSFPIRKMCRLIGETMSRNIERLSYASRLQARKLINTVPTEQNPGGYIVASSDDLLKLFDADFGLLSIREETKVLGTLQHSQEALALVEYLRIRLFTSIVTSQDLSVDFPDLNYAPGFSEIAGLLLVPLSIGGHDFIVFFRKGQLRQVNWAGNPYEKTLREGTQGCLEPRQSFRIWSETVVGKSREWTEEQVETAAVLCLVYGKFIEVWRQKEAALQKSQLTKLLLANASHEVRTPLNAIINYLEIALESPLDHETRDNLMRSHTASKSLIYVINDLLDLTRTEEGQDLVMDEIFDLCNTVNEATSIFKSDIERKKISLDIVEYPGLPKFVKGDQSRLRQALSNITGNAIQYTDQGGVKIEIWMPSSDDDRCQIEIAIQDTGAGMSAKKLDLLFREFEQVQTEEDQESSAPTGIEGMPNKPRVDQTLDGLSKIPGQKMLGLGLAVVARTIRNMNGQLRLKSEEGKGSRFTISLPFTLPSEKEEVEFGSQPMSIRDSSPQPQCATPPLLDQDSNELLLIDSSPQKQPSTSMERKNSMGSMKSLGSQSSERSEIDRLVHAISAPPFNTSPNETPISYRPSTARSLPSSKPVTAGPKSPPSPSPPGAPNLPRISLQSQPGQEAVEGSAVPIRAVRIPDEVPLIPSSDSALDTPVVQSSARILKKKEPVKDSPVKDGLMKDGLVKDGPVKDGPVKFKVLVAEDDPINSKIIRKRMEKLGHEVCLTVNGAECADTFTKTGEDYDIVLMDMQMPIMDGGTSTTRIRSHEVSDTTRGIPPKHLLNGRVPIFAVSASLVEERRKEYMELGFDGWILKPVDFKRLQILMEGILDSDARQGAAYQPGAWERGGWFLGSPEEAGSSTPRSEDATSP